MKTNAPIHVHRNGVTEGPFSLHEIFENLANGKLSDTDHVWDEEANNWLLIRDVFPRNRLEKAPSLPPPLPEMTPSLMEAARPVKPFPNKWIRVGFILLLTFVGLIALGRFVSTFSNISNKKTTLTTAVTTAPIPSQPSNNVPQVTPNQAPDLSEEQSQAELDQAENEVLQKVSRRAYGTVIQRLDNGYLIHAGLFSGQWEKMNALALQSFINNSDGIVEVKDYFVSCNNPTLVDDDTFDSTVYLTDDVFSYTNTLGAQSSVHALTLSKDDALSKLKNQIDARQAELADAARQAAQQDESNFVTLINDTISAISTGNLDRAQDLYNESEHLKPNDTRLNDVRSQLHQAQFQSAIKSFNNAIQSKDITAALTAFNIANGLSPNDPAIASFQKQLDQLKDGLFQGIDSKLKAGDVVGADKDYSDLAAALPDENRLADYKTKIVRSKFDLATKKFHQALQAQDIDAASEKLDDATTLIPNETSLESLQKELTDAKFLKGVNAFKIFLANGQFSEAKSELNKLQALNVETEQTTAFASQLAVKISDTISTIISRGKDALKANNMDGADQAVMQASQLDSTNPELIEFKAQVANLKLNNLANSPQPETQEPGLPLTKEKYFTFLRSQLSDTPSQSQIDLAFVPSSLQDRGNWAFFLKLLENSYGWQSPTPEVLAPYSGYPELTISKDDAWDPEAMQALWTVMKDLEAAYIENSRSSPSNPQASFTEASQAQIRQDMQQLAKFDQIPQLAGLREASMAFLKDYNAFLVNDYSTYLGKIKLTREN